MAEIQRSGAEIVSQDLGLDLKAKVAIVNSVGAILALRRSPLEDTRQGEWDWPGGSFDAVDTSISDVLGREVEIEEMPGTRLHDVRPLHVKSKIVEGGFKVSLLMAAWATLPEGGITLSHEHDDFAWFMPDEYAELAIPKKYKAAVVAGAPVLPGA